MLGLLRYVDGDLNDPATYEAMETPPVRLAPRSTALKQQIRPMPDNIERFVRKRGKPSLLSEHAALPQC